MAIARRIRGLRLRAGRYARNAASPSNSRDRISMTGQRGEPGGTAPARAVELTVTWAVAVDPLGLMELGEMLHADPLGAPEQLNATAWLNPPAADTVMVKVADCPALIVADAGVNE